MNGKETVPQTVLPDLEARLQQEKAAVIAEIRRYPPPIPACDAQFNHLTEQRSRLTVALNRLHALSPSASPASVETSAAFYRAIEALHPDVRTALHEILRQGR